MKRLIIVLFVLLLMIWHISPNLKATDEGQKNIFFINEARLLEKAGIIRGDKDGNLMLGNTLTRQDLVVVIARLYNEEDKVKKITTDLAFSDVKKDAYYYNYIAWALERKLITGISDTEFGVDSDVTVKELEVILLRILGYEEQAKNWNIIETLSASVGLLDGLEFKDNRPINRGELSKMIVNALNTERQGSTLKLKDILNVKLD
ncbi:MAG: S-layer homology domain-containing protein [Ezakiella sp.]|nr:S-layer homology domain-containing protein [Ezakiella sp.]